jgi:hypothetical protein
MIHGNPVPTVLRLIRPSMHNPTFWGARSFSHVTARQTINKSTKTASGNSKSAKSETSHTSHSSPKHASSANSNSSDLGFKELYRSLTPRLRFVFLGLVLIAGTAETLFWLNVIWARFSGKESNEKSYWLVVLWSKIFGTKTTDKDKEDS